jgi:outer membrane receptor protein involved in Fe transport
MFDSPPPDPPQQAIIVTGYKLPDARSERAFAVETISRQALVQAPSDQLEEVLEQIAGVQQFRRSDARSSHPTSQGVTLRALGGNASSRALVVLDGVPQSDPFGGWVNWPAYDPLSLARIRVVRGGGSVVNGPGALAGTIELDSLLAPDFDAALKAGSRDSFGVRFYGGHTLGSGIVTVAARAEQGDGFTPITSETRGPADQQAPYRAASLRALAAVPVTSNVTAQASLLTFIDERERGLAFTDNRTRGVDAALRLIGEGSTAWSILGYAQTRRLRSSFASVNSDRTTATQVALQDSVPSYALGGSAELRPEIARDVELRLGADFRATKGESRELYFFVNGEPSRRRRAGGEALTTGAFAELTVSTGKFTLTGAARLDRWHIGRGQLVERDLATGHTLREDMYAPRHGWLPTGRAGTVADIGGGVSLRAAAYVGWRLPTLNELFRPFRAGPDATAANAALDPERLAGAEIGANLARGPFEFSGTVFVNRLSHAIANVTLARGPGVFPGVGFVGASGEYRQRLNLDAIISRGVELSGAARRGEWSLRTSASLVDARVDADGTAAGLDDLRPAQTPRLVLAGTVAWERGRRAASLSLRHSGSQFDDDLNEQRLPAATTVDAFLGWPLLDRLQIVGRAENLLNERVIAGVAGGGAVERATPRTLWLELRFGR